jgi:hypothetical protein
MSSPSTLQVSFDKGMRRDVPRHQLPANAVWNLVDFVLGSVGAQERGGYTYASPDITTVEATASYIVNGMVAPFSTGDQHLCIDEDGKLYTITSPTVATYIDAALAAVSLSFHRENVIIPDPLGSAVPKVYNGSTVADLGGSPPAGKYACVFNDWTILAASGALPNRLWPSAAGNPASYDTSNAWFDADHKLCGVAAISGAVLGFTDHGVERWRGSVAPPGSDFTHNILTTGAPAYTASICQNGSNVFWVSQDGIFMTDGATAYDLTFDCGIKSHWQSLVALGASWSVSAGILADRYLIVSVMNATTFVDCFVIDVPLRRCWRWTNIDACGFWIGGESLYFGRRGAARVGELSSTFAKAAAVKADADDTVVTGQIETRFFQGPSGLKTWRALYPTYDLRDAATDDPTVQFSYILSPEATSYTDVGSAQAETTASTRPRIEVNKKSEGIALKLTRSSAAADFRLYGLDMDVYGMERSRTS